MKEAIKITSEQIRAARALLRWGQADLAEACNVSVPTIKRLEGIAGIVSANRLTLIAIERAFADAGIEFISDSVHTGVQLKK